MPRHWRDEPTDEHLSVNKFIWYYILVLFLIFAAGYGYFRTTFPLPKVKSETLVVAYKKTPGQIIDELADAGRLAMIGESNGSIGVYSLPVNSEEYMELIGYWVYREGKGYQWTVDGN